MATGTGPFDPQEIFNRILKVAGTSQDTDPAAWVTQPAFRQFVLHSVTVGTVGSSVGTTTTALGGYREAAFYVSFSTFTGTVATFDLYIDSRLDGTNFVNLAHINYTSATAATARDVILLTRIVGTGIVVGALGYVVLTTADLAAGTIAHVGWGDDLRIRQVAGSGTTAPIYSYTVTANLRVI